MDVSIKNIGHFGETSDNVESISNSRGTLQYDKCGGKNKKMF